MAKRVSKTTIFFTSLIIIIFAGIFGWNIFKSIMIKKFLASFHFPAATVTVTKAKQANWTPFIASTGTLTAVNGVNISPQQSGMVTQIAAKSGQMLKKGQLIVAQDTSTEEAELKSALAAEKLAQINYNRDLKLYKQDAISASALDTDKATLHEKSAAVEQYQATINQKHIRAPFAGRLGITQVNLGQFLTAGTSFTNLQTITPIRVDYTVPQQNISQLHVGQKIEVRVSTYPNKIFHGTIKAIDAQVGQDTRSIMVRGLIQNTDPKALLYPGMFSTVHTLLPVKKNLTTLPVEAVTYTLYGNTVYTIKDTKNKKTGKTDHTTKLVYVTTGMQQGNEISITKGIKPGEVVVTQGQIKLQDKAPVSIVNSVKSAVNTSRKENTKKKVG